MLNKSGRASGFLSSRWASLLRDCLTNPADRQRVVKNERTIVKCYSHAASRAKIEKIVGPSPVNKFVGRTHTCGELGASNVGDNVELCGWMEYQRMGKFIVLRDAYGSTQLVIPDEAGRRIILDDHRPDLIVPTKDLIDTVDKLGYESVLRVTGRVILRPAGNENNHMKTGCIEIQVESLSVINESISRLPFNIRHHNAAKESLQMQYRYLSLRFPDVQRNLRLRSRVTSKMREYLVDHCGFVDVETPTLFRKTPGGAQEFVVPTRHPGKFYSLVQSPQQFKQLLMIGGIDRYFQVARCYRDEGSRNDRQPEFTQLDIEMSFSDRDGIINLIEGLLSHCWPSDQSGVIQLPIPRMSYEQVSEIYGSEKPDLRIPYRIHNVSEFFNDTRNDSENQAYAIVFPTAQNHLTSSTRTKFSSTRDNNFSGVNFIQTKIVGDAWKTKISKLLVDEGATAAFEGLLNIKDGDALFIARGKKDDARSLLGKIRLEFTNVMESNGVQIRSKSFEFLWVLDFPLFYELEEGSLGSTHHPFTQPHPDDLRYLENDPLKVRGLHYDLVLNGSEIAGGSIRIHNADFQKRVFDMLKIDKSQMKHLIDGLASGAPPHGGIAFGLDRLMSIICDTPSIRSVIAFPKTIEGRDLMSGAPVEISAEDKRLYHLKTLDQSVTNSIE